MAKYLDSIGLSFFWSLFKSKLLPPGGQEGQVLAKASDADDDVSWLSTGTNNIIGDHLVAASPRQIVIGQYNEADQDEHRIIVGNGSAEDDRKNVFTVDRNGGVVAAASYYIQDDRFDALAPTMPTSIYRIAIGVTDEDENLLSWVQSAEYNSGHVATTLGARKTVNGTNVDNVLRLGVDADGKRGVYLNGLDAWYTALHLQIKSKTLNLTTTNIGGGTKTVYFDRQGNIVTAYYGGTIAPKAANTLYTVGTIPAGFRPMRGAFAHCIGVQTNTIPNRTARWRFLSNGSIQIICSAVGQTEYPFSVSWITNDAWPA